MSRGSSFEVWEAAHPWAPDATIVLEAGLVDELRENPTDERRDELARVVSELMSRFSGKNHHFGFSELRFRKTIARPLLGEPSAV